MKQEEQGNKPIKRQSFIIVCGILAIVFGIWGALSKKEKKKAEK